MEVLRSNQSNHLPINCYSSLVSFIPDRHFDSTPQLLARSPGRRAGAQLGPGDLRIDAAAQAAVGAGDDVFAADDAGEGENAIRHEQGADFQSHNDRDQCACGAANQGIPCPPLDNLKHIIYDN